MKNSNKEETSFWIAYADLMAGLLFVFILLIGAIVVKYVLTQSDLREIRANLAQREDYLRQNQEELREKEQIVFKLSSELTKTADTLKSANKEKVALEENVSNYVKLSKELNSTLDNKDKQILILLGQLERKEEELRNLQDDFKEAKRIVQDLHLIRENLGKEIQAKLDSNVSINEKTGSISLPAEVLFDKDSYVLKNEAKTQLRKILNSYFDLVLEDDNISRSIENIIIEGHTDSDGSYIYNLDLSQKRAYEVMNFIYTFYKDERLLKLLMASGRSFSEPILKDGEEDKNLSRRIEIKFSIKNDFALKEIDRFFEYH